jgi:hypothetical protein
MPSKSAPAGEWTEIVGASFEDDYTVVVDGADAYVDVGDKPVAGIPLSEGTLYSLEVDRGEEVYARGKGGDAEIRAVPGVRVDGSNERRVTVATTITSDSYENGDWESVDGSAYNYTFDPGETIRELLVADAGDITLEVTTVGGDTFDVDVTGGSATFDRWAIDSVVAKDPNGTTAPLSWGWAGE